MDLKYRHIPYEFSTDTIPYSIGELDRMLKNNRVALGSVYEILVELLYNTPGFRAGKFWFTLVNVTCSHTGFSVGILPAPPKSCMPLSGTWYYTFALSPSGYGFNAVPKHISLRGINSIAWGTRRGNEFLTICTTHYQAAQFGIQYNMMTPQYAYNLLGPMTKNFAVRNRFHCTDDDYTTLHQADLDMMYSKYYMMPLYQLMRNVAYHLWVFNRHVWIRGTALLSPRHMTNAALLFMCLNIKQISKLPDFVEAELVNKFHKSLTDFVQRQDSGEHAKDTGQLLYVALVSRGKIPDTNYIEWLTRQEMQLEVPTSDYSTHILSLLYA